MISKNKIDKIVEIIVQNYSPEKIILFGSYATGNPDKDSDLDLVIIKNTAIPRYKRTREIFKHLRGIKVPLDMLVYNNNEIKKWQKVENAFITQVMKRGNVLYER